MMFGNVRKLKKHQGRIYEEDRISSANSVRAWFSEVRFRREWWGIPRVWRIVRGGSIWCGDNGTIDKKGLVATWRAQWSTQDQSHNRSLWAPLRRDVGLFITRLPTLAARPPTHPEAPPPTQSKSRAHASLSLYLHSNNGMKCFLYTILCRWC